MSRDSSQERIDPRGLDENLANSSCSPHAICVYCSTISRVRCCNIVTT